MVIIVFLCIFIISTIVATATEYSGDIRKMFKAQSNNKPTYQDHKGTLRNSSNGHSINIGESGKLYDSWTGEMIHNPYASKESEQRHKEYELGYTKHRVFNNSTEECINYSNYGHKVVYRSGGTLYGKLNCNLGYQFWVNLSNGIMEETELSKKIPHTEVEKYHRKPIDNRKRNKQEYMNDYNRPYTQAEKEKENESILKHLENHNRNVINNPSLDKTQKFTPWWCHNPINGHTEHYHHEYDDDIIYRYEFKYEEKPFMRKTEEGWND